MKKVIRLTESDLVRIVKRVIRESEDDDSSKKRYESTLWKKYDFLPLPDETPSDGLTKKEFNQMSPSDQETFRLEHVINTRDLNIIIRLLGGEDKVELYLSRYKPLGITSVDELIDYKGGYPEEEY